MKRKKYKLTKNVRYLQLCGTRPLLSKPSWTRPFLMPLLLPCPLTQSLPSFLNPHVRILAFRGKKWKLNLPSQVSEESRNSVWQWGTVWLKSMFHPANSKLVAALPFVPILRITNVMHLYHVLIFVSVHNLRQKSGCESCCCERPVVKVAKEEHRQIYTSHLYLVHLFCVHLLTVRRANSFRFDSDAIFHLLVKTCLRSCTLRFTLHIGRHIVFSLHMRNSKISLYACVSFTQPWRRQMLFLRGWLFAMH